MVIYMEKKLLSSADWSPHIMSYDDDDDDDGHIPQIFIFFVAEKKYFFHSKKHKILGNKNTCTPTHTHFHPKNC